MLSIFSFETKIKNKLTEKVYVLVEEYADVEDVRLNAVNVMKMMMMIETLKRELIKSRIYISVH